MHKNQGTYDIAWYYLRGAGVLPGALSNVDAIDGVRPAMWIDEAYVNGNQE